MPLGSAPWEGRKPFTRPGFNGQRAGRLCEELDGHFADFWRTAGSTTIVSDRTFRIDRQGPNSQPPGVRLHIQSRGDSLAAVLVDGNLEDYAHDSQARTAIERCVIEAFRGSIGRGAGGQAHYWRVSGEYP